MMKYHYGNKLNQCWIKLEVTLIIKLIELINIYKFREIYILNTNISYILILFFFTFIQNFNIKLCKKDLLNTFQIYKDDEENLKKTIIDCLGINEFNDELHNKFFQILKGDEQKDQMEIINELIKEKENIPQFVSIFIEKKKEERIAAEQAEQAKQAKQAKQAQDTEQNDAE